MSHTRRLGTLIVASSLVLLAACGSDDETTTTDAPATTTTVAPAATDAPAATEAPAATDAPAATEAPAETTPATEAVEETVPATDAPEETTAPLGSLIDVATAAGNFTTLLSAIYAAGMTEEIATGKYTILAPTDEAFAAVDPAALSAILADPAQLTALLQHHVLAVAQDLHSISIFSKVVALDGTSLDVVKNGDAVVIAGANVIQPDLAADNGFIHGIDTVLLPAPAA